jgi:hypothetical protein
MHASKQQILENTHYGLHIYAHILRQYYPGEIVLSTNGKDCQPARNPFNYNKSTLLISVVDQCAQHTDADNAIPVGDVFDFAALHYRLTGDELLQKLSTDHNLVKAPEKHASLILTPDTLLIKQPIKPPHCSLFRHPVTNTLPLKVVDLLYVYNLIKYNHYQKQTHQLRALSNPKDARAFKAAHFDYVTFSGTFVKRSDASLIKHSGLITIDFDHVSNLVKLKQDLLSDEYFDTELLFISPSGDGLKWIISIDLNQASHQENFLAISNYIRHTYNIEVDKSGKDISRACFLPYDNEAFINPKYL